MFTLLVSWLLATCIPVLLMLAMLGLGRLETALAHDAVTATDVAEFLAQAEAVDVHTLAREGMPEALDHLHRRQAQRVSEPPWPGSQSGTHHGEPLFATHPDGRAEAGLPTRIAQHSRANPQLTATRHVKRV
ncbi:hypothetical protein [Mycobacterium lacus]|uniref:Uncharacterized protein n=1 Tax=Mycobacterium lacus TaxID=169765 RepID=A0A1X1Y3M0_9MYCO|nr:hypothetical protein [Mycobacterium lacus]MCV7125353.1 hypothetical protein [Mycobacterium lacus]ORW05723.1 hypothetical protein AWC15_01500 [Mycobacterium lacus]BBX99328.1 hypothetical protein MLAC_46220 [Mycobacterium lacus]